MRVGARAARLWFGMITVVRGHTIGGRLRTHRCIWMTAPDSVGRSEKADSPSCAFSLVAACSGLTDHASGVAATTLSITCEENHL